MKRSQILKQQYEVSNPFDEEAMFVSLKSQIGSKVFKELINNEKHSLSVEFRVFVNEEESFDKDPRLVSAIDAIKSAKELLQGLTPDEMSNNLAFFKLDRIIGKIDTSKL